MTVVLRYQKHDKSALPAMFSAGDIPELVSSAFFARTMLIVRAKWRSLGLSSAT